MRLRRSLAISQHDFMVLRTDPYPLVMLVLTPLLLMAFLQPSARVLMEEEGYDTNGADYAVPGVTVMFAFFVVSTIAFQFFREHSLRTWDRIRATPLTTPELLLGKLGPAFALAMVQQTLLFVIGRLVYGLHIRGSLLGVGLLMATLSLCLVAVGMVLAAFCRTQQQVTIFASVSVVLFGGFGGALSPVSYLPSWLRPVSGLTPTYWAIRGLRSIILDGEGIGAAVLPAAVLVGMAAMLALLAARRYRIDENKLGAL